MGRPQGPTVNGNNDECSLTVIPDEPRVVSAFPTGLTWSPFKHIRLSGNTRRINKRYKNLGSRDRKKSQCSVSLTAKCDFLSSKNDWFYSYERNSRRRIGFNIIVLHMADAFERKRERPLPIIIFIWLRVFFYWKCTIETLSTQKEHKTIHLRAFCAHNRSRLRVRTAISK